MALVEILPWLAGGLFIAAALFMLLQSNGDIRGLWMAPAGLAALFLCWSLWAVWTEGLTGFWPEHTRNKWGVQIWFDLLLAIGVAFGFLAPRARALGMNIGLWLVLIICTGSIGVLSMTARYLYLKDKA